MQAAHFERLSFSPFPLLQDGFVTPEVDVCGCDVVEALVVTLVGWCQFNANQSPKFAHTQVLGYKKVAPFAKRGVPVGFEG